MVEEIIGRLSELTESQLGRLEEEIPDSRYFDDVHGSPDYRKHMTHYFAEQIRAELADEGDR